MSDTVQARATQRWRAIVEASPELADAVRLQESIVAVLLEADVALRAAPPPLAFTRSQIVNARREAIPAFRVVEGALPASVLAQGFAELCRVLAPAGGGQAAQHIHEAVSSGRIDFPSLLWSSLARREDAVRMIAGQLDLAADLLWLIAELTVSPYANWLQEQLYRAATSPGTSASGGPYAQNVTPARDSAPDMPVAQKDTSLRDTSEDPRETFDASWPHGWCPACGSWPALATDDDSGVRTAHCSFCAHAWALAPRCPYCGDHDAWGIIAPVDGAPHRRLAWCNACRGYLKVMACDAALAFPMIAIEDLATADLDRLAFEVGWTRPQMAAGIVNW